MAKQKRQLTSDTGELNLTAMIDVVFQLLIYFIVTIKPEDVLTHLDVFRPSPSEQKQQTEPPKMIRVQIYPDGITINDKQVTIPELERLLTKLGDIDKKQTIMIMATALSKHEDLVRVLDLSTKAGLVNLSVVSTN